MYGALYTTPLCYDIRWHHNLSYRPLISRLDYSPSVSIQLCDWLFFTLLSRSKAKSGAFATLLHSTVEL